MKKIVMLPIFLGVAAAVSFVGLLATGSDYAEHSDGPLGGDSVPASDRNPNPVVFQYYDIEKVSVELAERGLDLSMPVPITDATISQYCTSHDNDDDAGIRTITYCLTSGISDTHGLTVGNLNVGGNTDIPMVARAITDPSPPIDSGRGHAVSVIESVIEGLVCECWSDERPGGFDSVGDWMRTAESRHTAAGPDSPPLRSVISGLGGTDMTLEVSIERGGYMWVLLVEQ